MAALVALLLLGAVTGARSTGAAPTFRGESLARVVDGDRPNPRLSAARLARSSIAWVGGPTVAGSGETVTVYVSPALAPELGTPQTWADFLAALVHGPELSALEAYIATLAETQEICGEYALGCYWADRMVSTGETAFDVTAAEVVRHEYGHHVAFHRVNPPWKAIDWGPKNWATTQNVCARATARSIFPGDEGDHYHLNPGEAWAETYRLLDERRAGVVGSGWQLVDSSFFPDEATLEAAERDVLQPWTSGRTTTHRTRFTPRSRRVWKIPLTTSLDGAVEITVSLPRGALHEVALVDTARSRVLARALWAGLTVKKLTTNVCGQRSLALRVTQKAAFGRVRVVVKMP